VQRIAREEILEKYKREIEQISQNLNEKNVPQLVNAVEGTMNGKVLFYRSDHARYSHHEKAEEDGHGWLANGPHTLIGRDYHFVFLFDKMGKMISVYKWSPKNALRVVDLMKSVKDPIASIAIVETLDWYENPTQGYGGWRIGDLNNIRMDILLMTTSSTDLKNMIEESDFFKTWEMGLSDLWQIRKIKDESHYKFWDTINPIFEEFKSRIIVPKIKPIFDNYASKDCGDGGGYGYDITIDWNGARLIFDAHTINPSCKLKPTPLEFRVMLYRGLDRELKRWSEKQNREVLVRIHEENFFKRNTADYPKFLSLLIKFDFCSLDIETKWDSVNATDCGAHIECINGTISQAVELMQNILDGGKDADWSKTIRTHKLSCYD